MTEPTVTTSATRWRLIDTGDNHYDGIAPICPTPSLQLHLADPEMSGYVDECGIFDCCPGPYLIGADDRQARALVAVLNAVAAWRDVDAAGMWTGDAELALAAAVDVMTGTVVTPW